MTRKGGADQWYYYLEEKLKFPFQAKCNYKRTFSPLKVGDIVEVIGMPPEEVCEMGMFVMVRRKGDKIAVPLAQLKGIGVDRETRQAMDDWRYWTRQGYRF